MPPQAPASGPTTIRDYLGQQADKYGIPRDLALAIVDTESGGTHQAKEGLTTSKTGARGFFQLMPETAKELGVDPNDPFQNIDGGLRYFKQQLDAHGGDVRLALAAYNAGPGRTQQGTVPQIPETQDYVLKVLKTWQQGGVAPRSQPSKPKIATPPPAAAMAGMFQASPTDKAPPSPDRPFIEKALVEPVVGFGKNVANTLGDIGRVAERVTGVNLPDLPEGDTTLRTTGEKIGGFAERTAEFALPGEAITAGRKSMQITAKLVAAGVTPAKARLLAAGAEGVGQALTAAGISTLHGDDPESAAIIAGASPVVGTAISQMGPVIRRGAITRMARFMERGMKGDITPELQKNLAQAASDFIDLPLKRTWRQMAAQTRGVRRGAAENLEVGLAGTLGDVPVPKAPVINELDNLVAESAQHLTPTKGGIRTVTYNPDLVSAVDDLKEVLNEYPDLIPARQLHDIKATWWEAIYPKREAAQPISSFREMLTSGQKEARARGAKAIAQVLEQDAPEISALDEAMSHAAKLDQFTKRLAVKARTSTLASPTAKYAIGSAGGAVGIGIGGLFGHPFIGANVGFATSRILLNAIESPRWRLIPIATRRSVANAIANGRSEEVRKLLTPIILANTAGQDDLLSAANSASASR